MASWTAAQNLKGLFDQMPSAVPSAVPDNPPLAPAPIKANLLVDFLTFRRMITPIIIQVIFWLATLAIIGIALYGIFAAIRFNNFLGVLSGLAMLVLGPIGARIYCELLILFFRMNETLTDIKNGLQRPGDLDR
jgi:hypothetical protein